MASNAAYNARALDTAVNLCAVDVKVFPDASIFPEAAPLVGRDQYRDFMEETWSAWSSGQLKPTEIREIGDGRVLVRAEWSVTGASSGVETSMNFSAIVAVRHGQISQMDFFFDHDKALEAAGLADWAWRVSPDPPSRRGGSTAPES